MTGSVVKPLKGASDVFASLEHLPLPVFGVGIGVLGLGICWQLAADVLPPGTGPIASAILYVGVALVVVVAIFQWLRFRHFRGAVGAELRDPIRGPMAVQPIIALQLIAEALDHDAPALSASLTTITTPLAVVAALLMVLKHDRTAALGIPTAPSWLLAGIALAVAALLSAVQGRTMVADVLLAAAATYFGLYLVLLLRHPGPRIPCPPPARPMLLIAMAPLPLLYLARQATLGAGAGSSDALFGTSCAVAVVLLFWAASRLRAPFGFPWWAAGMPPTVVVMALLERSTQDPSPWLRVTAIAAFAAINVTIAILLWRTASSFVRGALVAPSYVQPTSIRLLK